MRYGSGGRDDSVQHRAVFEAISRDGELVQPAPPRREALDLDHRRPQLSNWDRKCERAVVLDDIRGTGHPRPPTLAREHREAATLTDGCSLTRGRGPHE